MKRTKLQDCQPLRQGREDAEDRDNNRRNGYGYETMLFEWQ